MLPLTLLTPAILLLGYQIYFLEFLRDRKWQHGLPSGSQKAWLETTITILLDMRANDKKCFFHNIAPLRGQMRHLFLDSLKWRVESVYQVWCRYIKALLRFLKSIGCHGPLLSNKKNPSNNFCEAWSEEAWPEEENSIHKCTYNFDPLVALEHLRDRHHVVWIQSGL